MVEQEEQHLWMMNPFRAIIPIVESLVDKKNPFSFYDGYQNYIIQLLENLMYLGLHPPKDGKLHLCEKFHSMNTCHLHIG